MIFLTLIRALSRHLRNWLPAVLLLCCGATHADARFDGGAVSGCSYDGASLTYSCTFLPSGYITIDATYTVNIAGSASMGSAKIDGALNIGGSLGIDNHAYIDGSVNVGGAVSVGNHADITGDLTAAGDISMDTHSVVEGNLSGRRVELYNAFTKIGGNASVYSIIIGNKGEVDGTITCTAPGATGCSCVTDNSGHGGWSPTCGAAPPPVSDFDHIMVTHPGTALTCQPQTVTLTACANTACTAPHFSGRVVVTLQPGNQQFTITGGSNNAATIQQTTAGTATISATSATAPSPSTCLRTSDNSNSCQVTFSQVGLDMTIPDHKSENQQNITLQVLKQGTTSPPTCVAVLANTTQNVNFACGYVNPASASPAGAATVRINGISLGSSPTSVCGNANVDVGFDATGVATPSLIYADAGKMSLTASVKVNGVALSQTKQFIVAPHAFKFFATQGTKTNPEPTDETGAAFIPAGQVFSTKLAAVNALGAVTYNFGRETPAEIYANITQTLVGPSGGLNPPLYAPSGAAFGGFQAPVNGSDTQSMYFNEVGIISLGATLANPQGYLNAGASNFRTTGSTNIGRFYPDHFNTAITSLQMNCNAVTSATSPCPAANTGAGKFLYASQPFDMTATAYNANNTVTANYTGLYAKPVSFEVWKADATPTATQNPPSYPGFPALLNTLTWLKTGGATGSGVFAAGDFVAGVASTATAAAVGHPQYNFASIYPASTNLAAPTSVYLRAKESAGGDGVSSLRTPVPSPSGEALVSFVSGRLLVNNTYGNLSVNSPVRVTAQFWSGSAYVNNPAFVTAAAVPLAGQVSFSNCLLKGVAGTCVLPALQGGAALSFSGGGATFNITPPTVAGAYASGSADAVVNALLPYLPSTTGRATFGVYRAGPVVYLREVF